jgi:hypothetical protein
MKYKFTIMKKFNFFILLLSFFVLFSCDEDDNANQSTSDLIVEDKTYSLTSLVITEPVDLNDDGVYSTDIFDENPCNGNFSYTISFDDEKSLHPAWTGFALQVESNSNGNPEQVGSCGFLDGVLPFLEQNDKSIIFYYDTVESADIVGQLSDDGQQITFNATADTNAIFLREILTQDGTEIIYEDDIKLTYTLVE